MRSIPSAPILAALAIAALTAPGLARNRQAIPEVVPTGPAQSCIPLHQIRETRVHGDRTIDFIVNNRKAYRNTLPYDCSSLGSEERFSYATSLSQLCSTDIITVLYSTPELQRGASCGLGEFQPVTLPDPRRR